MSIQLCRGFSDEQWIGLRKKLEGNDQAAWALAIEVFERRIRERFLACIDALIVADSRNDIESPAVATSNWPALPSGKGDPIVVPGFAIMALCCLLMETLQSFWEKPNRPPPAVDQCTYPAGLCILPRPNTVDQFIGFLRRPAFRNAFDNDNVAKSFVRGVRNGILHEAETRGWVIWRDEPTGLIVERQAERYIVNRSEFYGALKLEFETYLQELRDPKNVPQRTRFMKKMSDIVAEC
jgi:hypothetical protein